MSAHSTVKITLNPGTLPPLTDEQRQRLAAVAAMPDAEIDYSDIPAQSADAIWTRPGALVPTENKQQVTLRIDAEVLDFFKGTCKRYQSRINAVLRAYVELQKKHG